MIETATAEKLVALAGNPNVGKTTIFNRLTGFNQKVGNYPGITVEVTRGHLQLEKSGEVGLLDVPGTYSLSAQSEEERIAMSAVAGLTPFERPDLVVLVVDATQLSRNLYLALQVIELGSRVVIALNMVDELEASGITVDSQALANTLGVPIVPLCASHGTGMDDLRRVIDETLEKPVPRRDAFPWQSADGPLFDDVREVAEHIPDTWGAGSEARVRALAQWALLSVMDSESFSGISPELMHTVEQRRNTAERAGRDLDAELIGSRYAWIDENSERFTHTKPLARKRLTERIDDVLLHPVIGFMLFLLVMGIVFQSLFAWASPLIEMVEAFFGFVGTQVATVFPDGLIEDFVVEALIGGVGSVLVFLPQILLLFFAIGIMEDTGYLSRVAFLMDRIMRMMGLHGRAFVPMLSGFACAIPAIMATRTMKRKRDRILTMMVVPLMTCSARLPVYLLIIAALFPKDSGGGQFVQGLLMISMYVFSTLTAFVAAAVLGRTLLKGGSAPLLLEMPPYRKPHWPSVLRMMWQRSALFLRDAGGVILVCTIVLWFLLSFPKDQPWRAEFDARRVTIESSESADRGAQLATLEHELAGRALGESYGGRMGHAIEPLIAPLGFDWKIGVGLVGAFAAREVFVSTMGVMYGVGETDEESVPLRERIRGEKHADGRPVYTPLVGLSLMIFFALACQCMSTLAAIYRETKSWGWPVFLFTYMTALAWIASFVVYQGGRVLGFE